MKKEVEEKILKFLEGSEKSTQQVIKKLKLEGFECSGRSLENLTKLEKKEIIEKKFDPKLKSFLWSLKK